jgi:hypothetical protein
MGADIGVTLDEWNVRGGLVFGSFDGTIVLRIWYPDDGRSRYVSLSHAAADPGALLAGLGLVKPCWSLAQLLELSQGEITTDLRGIAYYS